MKTQHTPGPWKFLANDEPEEVTTQDGTITICYCRYEDGKPFDELTSLQSEANARLIAAAPELLKMLEYVTENYIKEYASELLNNEIQELLNKAKGL